MMQFLILLPHLIQLLAHLSHNSYSTVNLDSLCTDSSSSTFSSTPTPSMPSPSVIKRPIKPPAWHRDYITSMPDISRRSTTPYPMSNYICYSNLHPNYHSFLSSLNSVTEPSTYSQAASDPKWVHAMRDELDALTANGTWEIVDLTSGQCCV